MAHPGRISRNRPQTALSDLLLKSAVQAVWFSNFEISNHCLTEKGVDHGIPDRWDTVEKPEYIGPHTLLPLPLPLRFFDPCDFSRGLRTWMMVVIVAGVSYRTNTHG